MLFESPRRRGPQFGVQYRTVEEQVIIEMLLLAGFAYDADKAAAQAAAAHALNRWVTQGLALQQHADHGRRFDPVEVFAFFKTAGLNGDDSFWSDRFVATERRRVTELSGLAGRMFKVELRREFDLSGAAVGKSLRLRAPLPLESTHGPLTGLDAFIEAGPSAELRVADGRLEARFVAEGQSQVTLGANFTLRGAYGGFPAHETHAPQDYLKPVEDLVVVSPAVQHLAHSLAGDSRSDETVVRAFWNFMMDELVCGPVHYDQIDSTAPCDWVLLSRWYDCRLGSALFIALCRARGIPARLVSGHFLSTHAPTNHSWVEVWLDGRGWMPIDFLTWDLSAGGREPLWRERLFGTLDQRLVMQRLPYEFTGALGIKLPNAWHMLQRPQPRGVSVSVAGLDRQPIYRDTITVTI